MTGLGALVSTDEMLLSFQTQSSGRGSDKSKATNGVTSLWLPCNRGVDHNSEVA